MSIDLLKNNSRTDCLTLSQSAKATGKSKSRIHRAIKNGSLPAHKGPDGAYQINRSELVELFPLDDANPVTHTKDMAADTKGYVYVLSNPSMPGLLKIGQSRNGGQSRAKQLSNTGAPTPFVVDYELFVDDCVGVECEVHKALGEKRVSKDREFFKCALKEAIAAIQSSKSFVRPKKSPAKTASNRGADNGTCGCGCPRDQYGECYDCHDVRNEESIQTFHGTVVNALRRENMDLREALNQIIGIAGGGKLSRTRVGSLNSMDISYLNSLIARYEESNTQNGYLMHMEFNTDFPQAEESRFLKLAYLNAIDYRESEGVYYFGVNSDSKGWVDQHKSAYLARLAS